VSARVRERSRAALHRQVATMDTNYGARQGLTHLVVAGDLDAAAARAADFGQAAAVAALPRPDLAALARSLCGVDLLRHGRVSAWSAFVRSVAHIVPRARSPLATLVQLSDEDITAWAGCREWIRATGWRGMHLAGRSDRSPGRAAWSAREDWKTQFVLESPTGVPFVALTRGGDNVLGTVDAGGEVALWRTDTGTRTAKWQTGVVGATMLVVQLRMDQPPRILLATATHLHVFDGSCHVRTIAHPSDHLRAPGELLVGCWNSARTAIEWWEVGEDGCLHSIQAPPPPCVSSDAPSERRPCGHACTLCADALLGVVTRGVYVWVPAGTRPTVTLNTANYPYEFDVAGVDPEGKTIVTRFQDPDATYIPGFDSYKLPLGGVVTAQLDSDGVVTLTSLATGKCVVAVTTSYADAQQHNPFGENACVDEQAAEALQALFAELREEDPVLSVPCEVTPGRLSVQLYDGTWVEYFGSGTSSLTGLGADGALMAGRPLRLWRGAEELHRDEVARLLGGVSGTAEDDDAWAERVAGHLAWMTDRDSTPGALAQYGGSLHVRVGPDEPERLQALAAALDRWA
jgi:hypothetical protein